MSFSSLPRAPGAPPGQSGIGSPDWAKVIRGIASRRGQRREDRIMAGRIGDRGGFAMKRERLIFPLPSDSGFL
jgi:hypothetical protein